MKLKIMLNKFFVFICLSVVTVYLCSCSPGDDDAPEGIDDLQVTASGKLLNWTSPGDDGDEGQAILYLIRFFDSGQVADLLGVNSLNGVSFSEIQTVVKENFDDATQVPEFIEPQKAGNPEFFAIPRIDISLNSEFYYVISTNDETGNTSKTSNVVEVTSPLIRSDITS
ncbi:MAG: hypothetical protein GTO02_14740, partial [Candidatus Dadabacteria bacterium]|nr:hypothetical protein [Candidatus Dadabacteria bacterium]NIQ15599.1 hypothetical protein [Candidatus Dadabacteria bacterium]